MAAKPIELPVITLAHIENEIERAERHRYFAAREGDKAGVERFKRQLAILALAKKGLG
jgi:hypothetical protein